ncbi:hypothetical protein [Streptomyces sp. S186]|uniref:hypothetical protein n=1 Tax=Streptomyces sp. S186 TaxID=3434395 RepID=UPI003F6619F3
MSCSARSLTEQLTAARHLETPGDHPTDTPGTGHRGRHPPPEPLPAGYSKVLAAIENAEEGLRARDVCQALGPGTEPRHTEGTRAKLKRLVNRGVLTEPEPGLFTLIKPTLNDTETNSS